MQIDIFSELTGILDPCEGIEQSPETSAEKNTFSQETTKRNSRLVPLIDIFSLKGFRCKYSIVDAATSLWQRENTIVWRDETESMARLRARLQCGNFYMFPSEEELKTYLEHLRENRLEGQIDWRGFIAEFKSFQEVFPEELMWSLDYMASRCVSIIEKLKRNFAGSELVEQKSKLKDIWKIRMSTLINQYTQFLQRNLGISDLKAQAVWVSLAAYINQRICIYGKAVEQIQVTVSHTAQDAIWLCNHDAYIAARLREAVLPPCGTGLTPAEGIYSFRDLTVAGQIAQTYKFLIERTYDGGQNEAQLALNFAFADMQEETLIQRGIVSSNMAALLRGSRIQGHSIVLNAMGESLAADGSKNLLTVVDQSVFQGIYKAVLDAYHQNGNNVAKAIRAGVSYGEVATTQAHKENPKASRWGRAMNRYWKKFYVVPDTKNKTPSERQIEKMLVRIGHSPHKSNSTYQNYINEWRIFLKRIEKI